MFKKKKRDFFGIKIISSEDVDIEKAELPELSEKTKKVIRKSQVESLQPLLDSDPEKAKAAWKRLLREYWGLPEPPKAA